MPTGILIRAQVETLRCSVIRYCLIWYRKEESVCDIEACLGLLGQHNYHLFFVVSVIFQVTIFTKSTLSISIEPASSKDLSWHIEYAERASRPLVVSVINDIVDYYD